MSSPTTPRPAPRTIESTDLETVLDTAHQRAVSYLNRVDSAPAKPPGAQARADDFTMTLPEQGLGAPAALDALADYVESGAVNATGPRFFHLVAGGSTPAAVAGDWLCSAYDQHAYAAMSSPAAVRLERAMIAWLADLFGLPARFGGVMVTGGTMANFTALACARQWWGVQHGIDTAQHGLNASAEMPLLTSGLVHSSIPKACAMLGLGRDRPRTFARDNTGRVDLPAMRQALEELDGAPAVIVANAGEVNAGLFDPITDLADLAEQYNCWLHVDGTVGLFAATSTRLRHLVEGVERAHSVTADGHKWLNVPFENGFCFMREQWHLAEVFSLHGAYLRDDDDTESIYGHMGPEMSRRARALPVFATLAAYGRDGYRAIVENSVHLATRLAAQVEQSADYELLAEPELNIVSFRYHPPGVDGSDLDTLNSALGRALLDDGRLYAGTTTFRGVTAFKPAFVNWRTTEHEVDLLLPTLRELAAAL